MEGRGLYIAGGLGFEGFGGVSEPRIAIGRLRIGEGLGEGLVGCVDGLGYKERRDSSPARVFGGRKHPTKVPATVPLYLTVGLSKGLRMR